MTVTIYLAKLVDPIKEIQDELKLLNLDRLPRANIGFERKSTSLNLNSENAPVHGETNHEALQKSHALSNLLQDSAKKENE
ncbi:MAG: hypothetical protein WBW94_08205 [Anaerolineales bacterium]